MVHVLITHQVKDFASWKVGYDAGKPMRTENGVISDRVFQDSSDPNRVTLLMECRDLGQAKAFLENEDLKAAMAAAGVINVPEASFPNAA